LNILKRFSTHPQITSFMKIHPVGAESFHVDGQTDVTKLAVAFRNFADMPKNATAAPDGYSGKGVP
jgi:hypothetical protein